MSDMVVPFGGGRTEWRLRLSKDGEEHVSVSVFEAAKPPGVSRREKRCFDASCTRRTARVEGRAALSWKFKFHDLHHPLSALHNMSVDQINPGQAVYAQDEVSA